MNIQEKEMGVSHKTDRILIAINISFIKVQVLKEMKIQLCIILINQIV